MVDETPTQTRATKIQEDILESSARQEELLQDNLETTGGMLGELKESEGREVIDKVKDHANRIKDKKADELYAKEVVEELKDVGTAEPGKKDGIASEETQQGVKDEVEGVGGKVGELIKDNIKEHITLGKRWIEDKTSFSNFWGTLKGDMSMMTGSLKMLNQIPGVSTALGAIKFILSNLAIMLTVFLFKKFPGFFKAVLSVVNFFRRIAGKDEVTGLFGYKPKEKEDKEEETVKGKKKEGTDAEVDASFLFPEDTLALPAPAKEKIKKKQEETEGYLSKFWGDMKEKFRFLKEAGKDGWAKAIKAKNDFLENLQGKIYNMAKKSSEDGGIGKGLGKESGKLADSMKSISGVFGKITKALKKAGKAVWGAIYTFVTFTIPGLVGTFIGATVAIGTLTVPVWLIVLAVLALAIGMWYFWEELTVAWNKTKEWFWGAVEKVKSWGPKIKQFFIEAGEWMAYTFKRMIAKIKDGVLNMANSVIDKVNKVLPERWEIDKFDASNVEALDKDWQAKQLAKRNPADAQKALADSEDLKELSVAELESKIGAAAGQTGVVSNVNNQNLRANYTGRAVPRDQFANQQNRIR